MAPQKADLTEFYKLSRPKRPPCRIGFALDQLDAEERTNLEAALAEDKGLITAGAILLWLKARGHDASISGISTHRRGACTCYD